MHRDDAAGEVVIAAAFESRLLHHPEQRRLVRMRADRLGEIAVARFIARHPPAEQRQDAERVGVVEPLQARHARVRELEHQQLPAGLQRAPHGTERRSLVRHVAQTEADRSEEHTSELQSPCNLVCRLLLEKKNTEKNYEYRAVLL